MFITLIPGLVAGSRSPGVCTLQPLRCLDPMGGFQKFFKVRPSDFCSLVNIKHFVIEYTNHDIVVGLCYEQFMWLSYYMIDSTAGLEP